MKLDSSLTVSLAKKREFFIQFYTFTSTESRETVSILSC